MKFLSTLVADRKRLQNSAYVKLWRLRKGLSIELVGNLLYEKKKIVQKSDVKRVMTKTFIKNKSGGSHKIRARAVDRYSGLSKRNVL